MIAAIAFMGGYEVHSDKVKTLVYSVVGVAAADILKDGVLNSVNVLPPWRLHASRAPWRACSGIFANYPPAYLYLLYFATLTHAWLENCSLL